jgi:CRISPR-associated protein Cas5h
MASNSVDVPPKCLSFTISGQWGHFKDISGNVVRETYRIMPRTTIAGMIAAMLGLDRNSYYPYFQEETASIAVEPTTTLRTLNVPVNTLSTDDSGIQKVKSGRTLTLNVPDSTKARQRHVYEFLVDPSYRIDIWMENKEMYSRLKTRLEEGTSHYTPSLGLSELLATINYHGEFEPSGTDVDEPISVDSAVPNEHVRDIIPSVETTHRVEKSPSIMEADDGGRITTDFSEYGYNPAGDSLKVATEKQIKVDGRTVLFN